MTAIFFYIHISLVMIQHTGILFEATKGLKVTLEPEMSFNEMFRLHAYSFATAFAIASYLIFAGGNSYITSVLVWIYCVASLFGTLSSQDLGGVMSYDGHLHATFNALFCGCCLYLGLLCMMPVALSGCLVNTNKTASVVIFCVGFAGTMVWGELPSPHS
jgi:hypothetical protein